MNEENITVDSLLQEAHRLTQEAQRLVDESRKFLRSTEMESHKTIVNEPHKNVRHNDAHDFFIDVPFIA